MRTLGLETARLTLVWDWYKDPGIVAGTDAWVAAVKEARMRPLITFTRNWRRSGRRYIPSLKRYVESFRLLRERYPHVREFSPWNEPNAKEQPFYRKPGRAALYFNAMRKECRRCTVLAGDVKDGTSMLPWLASTSATSAAPRCGRCTTTRTRRADAAGRPSSCAPSAVPCG